MKFFKSLFSGKVEKISLASISEMEYSGKLPILHESSTSFFSQRLAKAFPGQRGIKWYDSADSINRLEILLQQPLVFGIAGKPNNWIDPVWWFRGGSSSSIKYFERLSKTKFLMDIQETEVKTIAVIIDDSYYKSFVYVEARGEKSLTKRDTASIDHQKEYKGYANEEYGLFNKKTVITRQEYDDGAAVIRGKVMDTGGQQELRVRYLSDYNFIITAKESPYNSRKFDTESKPLFSAILKGEKTPQDLFDLMASYQRNEV